MYPYLIAFSSLLKVFQKFLFIPITDENMVPRCFEWVTLDYLFKKVIVVFYYERH